MEVSSWGNQRTKWWIFQQATFDCRRVPSGNLIWGRGRVLRISWENDGWNKSSISTTRIWSIQVTSNYDGWFWGWIEHVNRWSLYCFHSEDSIPTVTSTKPVFDIGQKAPFQVCWFPSPLILWPCKGKKRMSWGQTCDWYWLATLPQHATNQALVLPLFPNLIALRMYKPEFPARGMTDYSIRLLNLNCRTAGSANSYPPKGMDIWTTNHCLDMVSKFQTSIWSIQFCSFTDLPSYLR